MNKKGIVVKTIVGVLLAISVISLVSTAANYTVNAATPSFRYGQYAHQSEFWYGYSAWRSITPTSLPTPTSSPRATPSPTSTPTPTTRPTPTPSPTPSPTTKPDSGTLYWKADFEEGNFQDLTGTAKTSNGEAQVTPGATLNVETSNVFAGHYAAQATVTYSSGINHAKAISWTPARNIADFYFGAAIYLPSDFVSKIGNSGWVNVMQIHGMTGNDVPAALMANKLSDGTVKFTLWSMINGGSWRMIWRDTIDVTNYLGKWFTAIMHIHSVSNGVLELWINGNLKVTNYSNYAPSDQYANGFVDAGTYVGSGTPNTLPMTVYVDNMVLASTYATAYSALYS